MSTSELRRDAEHRRLFRFVVGTASDGYPSAGYESMDEDVLALLGERDQLAAAVERVRALHTPNPAPRSWGVGAEVCGGCSGDEFTPSPCDTRRALDGTDEKKET